jgi:hypothetical protein
LVIRASDIAGNTAHILYDAKRVGPCSRERGRTEIWQHDTCPPFSIISQRTDLNSARRSMEEQANKKFEAMKQQNADK